jgi:hypothetical protein
MQVPKMFGATIQIRRVDHNSAIGSKGDQITFQLECNK